jgi:hypothetical protein
MIKKEEARLSEILSFECDHEEDDSMECNETIEDISMWEINNATHHQYSSFHSEIHAPAVAIANVPRRKPPKGKSKRDGSISVSKKRSRKK